MSDDTDLNALADELKKKLKRLRELNGKDFYLFYQDEQSGKKWDKWHTYDEWAGLIETRTEYKSTSFPNQRQVLENEVIIELDAPTKDENARLYNEVIMPKLENHRIAHECWWSGNKSRHIHIMFSNLAQLNDRERECAKRLWLQKYFLETSAFKFMDFSKTSSKTLIQIESTLHRKSRNKKTLVSKVASGLVPKIKNRIIKIAVEKAKHQEVALQYVNSMKRIEKCPFLDYALVNKLPEGGRNNTISKNLAIYLAQNKPREIESLVKQYCDVQKLGMGTMIGWMRKAKDGTITRFNFFEIQGYQLELMQSGFDLPVTAKCSNCPNAKMCKAQAKAALQ